MKLPDLRKMFRRGEEQRSITGLPWDVGGPVSQGPLTSEQALGLVPVFAAVRLLADQVASLPMQTFRKVGDQRTRLPLPSLFTSPSVIGTQFDWLHRCVTSLALRGNAYGLITQRNALGYPTMVEWLHPDHVQVLDRALYGPGSFTQPIWYWLGRVVPTEDIVHIPLFAVPYRVKGLSPIEACAAAISTGVSAQDYTANWFANGAVPPGVFKNIQKTIDQKEADEIKSRLGRAIKTRQPLVHGVDWDYSPIAVAAHEAKFIETLKLNATQVANIYGVPPDMVGGDAGASGMTYRNENNSGLDMVKYTLRPWLERLEEKFSGLLPQPQFVKFNLDAILRADLPQRMAAYVEARNIGIMNVDEIRALEDLPPLPDGKGQDYTPLLVQVSQSRGIDAAQVKADQPPATPAVAEPTRLRAVVGIDDAEVLEIDAGPKAPLRGASAAIALEARRRDPSDPLAMERKFDPSEPRRPDGEWGLGGVAHKALRLLGSRKVSGRDGEVDLSLSEHDDGRRLHISFPTDESDSALIPSADLDDRNIGVLRDGLDELDQMGRERVQAAQKIADRMDAAEPGSAEYKAAQHAYFEIAGDGQLVGEGSAHGENGEIVAYQLTMVDEPTFYIGVRPADAPPNWNLQDEVDNGEGARFTNREFQRLRKQLGELASTSASRAAGHDTTPGHDQLHHYWTKGEGLAKWAESPKPWTTLVANLVRVGVPLGKAKVYASRWFIEVFGYAAGSDKNRVAHGHPPRGHKVGPG